MFKMKLFVLIILGICSLAENVKDSQFTANVYREMAKKDSKTFSVCPLSAKIVLALAQMGAGGTTAEQLAEGLDLPKNSEKLKNYIHRLLPQLHGNKHYELKSANKIYVEDGYPIKKQYKRNAVNIFKAEIENINFGNGERAAKEINEWVEKHTNNKIKNMVSANGLSGTYLVLINAMYFHGKWVTKFKKEVTEKRDFHRGPNDQISIDMMEVTSKFNYYISNTLSATFLEMPYQGKDVTMTLVLPKTSNGFSNLEARIAEVLVPFKYAARLVTVTIPKFKIDTAIEFTPILQHLGIRDAFGAANFSGISETLPPISSVMQKTFIEVDEEGTTAAAATMGKFIRTGKIRQAFLANRPFIFYLKSKIGILFIGRYTGFQ